MYNESHYLQLYLIVRSSFFQGSFLSVSGALPFVLALLSHILRFAVRDKPKTDCENPVLCGTDVPTLSFEISLTRN